MTDPVLPMSFFDDLLTAWMPWSVSRSTSNGSGPVSIRHRPSNVLPPGLSGAVISSIRAAEHSHFAIGDRGRLLFRHRHTWTYLPRPLPTV